MKVNILRGILIILLLWTFSIIFGFSGQDSEESSSLSMKITQAITANIKTIQEKPAQEKEKILSHIESIVRKIAHFSIYTVVGFLIMALISTYKIEETNRIAISLISGIVYAISDEIHQAFIPRKISTNNRCNDRWNGCIAWNTACYGNYRNSRNTKQKNWKKFRQKNTYKLLKLNYSNDTIRSERLRKK